MSMISDLVDRLETESKSMGKYGTDYMATLLMQASATIITLSEKARADRPQGEVDAVEIYEKAESQLEHNEITIGEFEKIVEPLRHLFYNRPQGEWIDAEIPLESGGSMPIQVCNLCKTFYPLAYTGGGHRFCPNCGCRMKGANDER